MVKIDAIILAGGESSRMGFDKAFLKIDDKPIIEGTIDKLKVIFDRILIVTNHPRTFEYLTCCKTTEIRIISDIIPDKGPLGGIYTGLLNSDTKHNFVLACDMPFINLPLIKYILAKKNDYDIIMPLINGRYHPLFGVYSKNCIPFIEEMLKQEKLRIVKIFPQVKTKFITKVQVQRFDKNLLSLININTPQDLKRIKEKRKS